MPGNSFGERFRITTFGESHGPGIGVVIDGCPAGTQVSLDDINKELARRRPGQSQLTTARREDDIAVIQSGVVDRKATGAPIALWIANSDARESDYTEIAQAYRPSHADYTYQVKYGVRDPSGGGRSSARETAARVAAGVIARSILSSAVQINAYVTQVHNVMLTKPWTELDLSKIDGNAVRCPDAECAKQMEAVILAAKESGDTVGGVIQCIIQGCPPGLGEPVFDKLHADLGKAILSINACKGVEFGSGFQSALMKGSEHNDAFSHDTNGNIITNSNHSGGIQGGISNGMPIVFRAAFKPVSTIMRDQQTVDTSGQEVTLKSKGRHDPCVLPRAVPIVEAMVAIVLSDHLLKFRSIEHRV
ncbi:MAG TPA: chorismate synthase [Saprospiraceae bacterium]|nr:chorismate synthase [Saprospiraceae bacterium]